MNGPETVLVTGGSGFIGGWCVIRLLEQGYCVRTTVRSLARENSVRAALGKVVDVRDRLSFHVAELTSDGWDVATSGCDFVLHVASPVTLSQPKNPDELIAPARDGTRRVVDAAIRSGVRRVVLTSSVAAASRNATLVESVSDETVWTDLDDPKVSAYARSKTLAERMAWDLIASSAGATTLVTINPSVVLGPVLSGDVFCVCSGCGTPAVRQGTWHSQAWLQCCRRTRCRRPAYPSDDRAGGCWTEIYRGWDLRLDGGSRNPPACPPRRCGQQGSDAPGPGLSRSAGGPLQRGAAGSSAAPWPEARFHVGEGASHARLATTSAGGNCARLRQEFDRYRVAAMIADGCRRFQTRRPNPTTPASSTDESSTMPSRSTAALPAASDHRSGITARVERRATLQHQEHAEREDRGRSRRHAERRRPRPAMARKPAEQRIGHQREQTKEQAAPAQDIRPEAEAATAADRDRSEQRALECEQRSETEGRKIDLKEVHQVVGNAVPQPKGGQNGEGDAATRRQRPQRQKQREDAEAIGDHLRRPDRAVVGLEEGKIGVCREGKRPHALHVRDVARSCAHAFWRRAAAPASPRAIFSSM